MTKKYPSKMTNEELNKLAAEVEGEFLWERSRPLIRSERARWKELQRGRGRPRRGLGAKAISVTVEQGLLYRADALAKRLSLTRAELVSRGLLMQLKAFCAAEGSRKKSIRKRAG